MIKKKKFIIEIIETLSRLIEVEAESEENAIKIITDLYNREDIILDSSDYVDTNIKSYN